MRILPTLAVAAALPFLASGAALAHHNEIATKLAFSDNPVTAGTMVTITATLTYTGDFVGGSDKDHVFYPAAGDSVDGQTVQISMLQADGDTDGIGDGPGSGVACGTPGAVFENVATGSTDSSGVFDTVLDTTPLPGTVCIRAEHPSFGGKHGSHQSSTIADLIINGAGLQMLVVTKTLISGPLTGSDLGPPEGCNVGHYPEDETVDPDRCTGFAQDYYTGPADAGPIGTGLDYSQHYVYYIEVHNTGADYEYDGTVLFDAMGADWDLDPAAHEDYLNDHTTLDGDCGADETCDGWVGGSTELSGVLYEGGDCSYTLSQPDSADNDKPPPKQPEFLGMRVNSLETDGYCGYLVFVQTVENPGKGHELELYQPTDCHALAYTTVGGDPIFDTYTLNEGIKGFDGETGDRLWGPVSTLQLTCNGYE